MFALQVMTGIVLLAIGGGILYLVLLVGTAKMRRVAIERVVIGQVATVVRTDLPLAAALALAADSESPRAARQLRRIAQLVARGMTLSEAVARGYPDCPGMVLSMITAGEQAGRLAEALDQAEQYLVDQQRWRERIDPSVIPYVVAVLTFALAVTTLILVGIVPKYRDIFADFKVRLPESTIALVNLSQAAGGLALLLLVAVIALTPFLLYLRLRPRQASNPALTSRAADWVRWQVPGLRRMQFGEGMAAALRMVRLAVLAGLPLERAVRLGAELDVNWQLRRRLRRFADLLAVGADARLAAAQAELGEVTGLALGTGGRRGDLAAGLRYAADYHEAMISRWWLTMSNLAWPCCTLMMATVIGAIVVSLIAPAATLMNSVGDWS